MSFIVTDCLNARSRMSENIPSSIDALAFIPPMRTLAICGAVPHLAIPLGMLHFFGYVKCILTMKLPSRKGIDYFDKSRDIAVNKRYYDQRQKRVVELLTIQDADEISRGLEVCGTRRNEFVNDPNAKGVAYYVIERKRLNADFMFRGENWAYGFLSDFFRFAVPVFICLAFGPSIRRLNVDLLQWKNGQLLITQIRHPAFNFFQGLNEYNQAKYRMNVNRVPQNTRPWHFK